MSTICHFEIPADDTERVINFYSELFDWKIEKFSGSSVEDYWMIDTAPDSNKKGSLWWHNEKTTPSAYHHQLY